MEIERDMDSNNNMAEKVISRVDSILKDANLQDFSIIWSAVLEPDRNVSPVIYVADEHCFGLESWCIEPIFRYSQQQILKLRANVLRNPTPDNLHTLNTYLNMALLIQPEVNTFWNIKRELYTWLCLANEMQFTKLVLSHKPKTSQIYTYRIWLISQLPADYDHTEVLNEELAVINKAVNLPNNYHAWNHRIWCMENLVPKEKVSNIIINELQFSAAFISNHVSEHSGFHYRQYILKQFKQRFFYPANDLNNPTQGFNTSDYCRIINTLVHEQYFTLLDPKHIVMCNQYVNLLLHELNEVLKELHMQFVGHEAIWYHRRCILFEIIQFLNKIYCIDTSNSVNTIQIENEFTQTANLLSPEVVDNINPENGQSSQSILHINMKQSIFYKNLVKSEIEFICSLREHTDNNSDISLIKKHEKWLHCFLDINLLTDSNAQINGAV